MEKKNNIYIPFSLNKFLKLCLKYWYVFAICIVSVLFLSLAYLYIRKPAYEVDAQLMLPAESPSGGILALNDLASSFSLDDMFGGSSTENEIMVMKSYGVFKQTAEDLNLCTSYFEKTGFLKWMPVYEKSQISLTTAPEIPDTITRTLLFKLNEKNNGNFNISLTVKRKVIQEWKNVSLPITLNTNFGDYTFNKTQYYGQSDHKTNNFKVQFCSYGGAAESYNKLVKIFTPNKKADFIGMSVIVTDPDFGQLLLNSIIDNYNAFGTEKNVDKNNRTLRFVNKRIESLEKELAQAQNNMESFKKANNLTDVEVDAAALLQKQSALDGALLAANTEKEILQNTLNFIENPQNNYSLIPSISPGGSEMSASSAAVASEIGTYNELIMERMKLSSSAKPSNAALTQLNNQIDALRNTIIASVQRAYANSGTRLSQLQRENNLTQSRMGSIPTLEKEYIGLERDLKLQHQLYLFLLKQREEAEMSLTKTSPSLITVDAPYTLATSPGLSNTMILILAFFIGLVIAMIFIYYFRMNKAQILTFKDVSDFCDAPTLGQVTKAENNAKEAINEKSCGESLRMLRSNTLFAMEDFSGKIIMVVSSKNGEGKTFVATNLAKALTLASNNILLIDADLRNPGVEEALGINSASAGLVQYIKGAEKKECITSFPVSDTLSLDVMSTGKIDMNPADILSEKLLKEKLCSLRQDYDYIVIDTASLIDYSDTFALADSCDITLYLARIDVTTIQELEYANSLYADKRLKRIAMVANGTKA